MAKPTPSGGQFPACPDRSGKRLDGGLLGGVLFHLEGGAAAAGGDDIRVVHLEAGALEALDVVDLRAEDELHAGLVDDHRNAVDLEDVVVLLRPIEGERVLEAGAAAAADRDAQGLIFRSLLRAQQLSDLLRPPYRSG